MSIVVKGAIFYQQLYNLKLAHSDSEGQGTPVRVGGLFETNKLGVGCNHFGHLFMVASLNRQENLNFAVLELSCHFINYK